MKTVKLHFTKPFDPRLNDTILVVFIFSSFIRLVFCKCHRMSACAYSLCVCLCKTFLLLKIMQFLRHILSFFLSYKIIIRHNFPHESLQILLLGRFICIFISVFYDNRNHFYVFFYFV